MKVQVSLDDELVKRIDNFADSNYMTRSGCISQACVDYLNQKELVSSLIRMSLAFDKIAVNNEIDEETKGQIEEFRSIIRFVQGSDL